MQIFTAILKNLFIQSIKLMLQNCEFFSSQPILQLNFGCPMHSCWSPIISDIALFKRESEILNFSQHKRYIDDILLLIPTDLYGWTLKNAGKSGKSHEKGGFIYKSNAKGWMKHMFEIKIKTHCYVTENVIFFFLYTYHR